jgi:hypothetical protein
MDFPSCDRGRAFDACSAAAYGPGIRQQDTARRHRPKPGDRLLESRRSCAGGRQPSGSRQAFRRPRPQRPGTRRRGRLRHRAGMARLRKAAAPRLYAAFGSLRRRFGCKPVDDFSQACAGEIRGKRRNASSLPRQIYGGRENPPLVRARSGKSSARCRRRYASIYPLQSLRRRRARNKRRPTSVTACRPRATPQSRTQIAAREQSSRCYA